MASFKRCSRGLEVQTLLFPRDVDWTASRARAWAREHGFSSSKVDTTAQYFRVRNRNPNAFVRGSFRTIVLSEKDDVNAVVGCPKAGREADKKTARGQTSRGETARRRDVSRFDLSPAGKRWMSTYQREGASPEVREAFERLSRFDKAAIRFLLTENGPPSSRDPLIRVERGPTGAAAWHVGGDSPYILVWNGPGGRLYLTFPGSRARLVSIDHPDARDRYDTFKEANAAARRFARAPLRDRARARG